MSLYKSSIFTNFYKHKFTKNQNVREDFFNFNIEKTVTSISTTRIHHCFPNPVKEQQQPSTWYK